MQQAHGRNSKGRAAAGKPERATLFKKGEPAYHPRLPRCVLRCRAAMDLHPDRFATAPEQERASAQIRFQKLQKAYAIMKEPSQKAVYDSGKILSDFVV